MGVPAFFRWLTKKYPKITTFAVEQTPAVVEGTEIPIDLREPNPNGIEFSNLYLDMNGIIHPCSHPEEGEAPRTVEEMFVRIMEYIDRLVGQYWSFSNVQVQIAVVRPREVLYMAIDGVAPRAKMNQQRSRRFQAAREMEKLVHLEEKAREEMKSTGRKTPPPKSRFDSNVITPGTSFMTQLASFLRYYIHQRMETSQYWKGIKVILSDATAPGEGEHKLMAFIREQRAQEGYNPNTVHCIHGLDADLIMLGLVTHEPHFYILREEVVYKRKEKGALHQRSSMASRARETVAAEFGDHAQETAVATAITRASWKKLELLHIPILREYLAVEFECLRTAVPFEFDLENILDDFVFLCFFVGNDFIPHLPSLDIREGAIDMLLVLYKRHLSGLEGYLTSCGKIHFDRVDIFAGAIGLIEDTIFLRRARNEKMMEERQQRRKRWDQDAARRLKAQKPVPLLTSGGARKKRPFDEITPKPDPDAAVEKGEEGGGEEDTLEVEDDEEEELAPAELQELQRELKSRVDTLMKEGDEVELTDSIHLGERGAKDRYYEAKFGAEVLDAEGRVAPAAVKRIARNYAEGLAWVLAYYYKGCQSWTWYYPHHYAPFASDMINLEEEPIVFDCGVPFKPITQLMGVLPPQSSKCLPRGCQALMTERSSPIIDFYPKDFAMDPNGKKFRWLWIALLPFISETRLLKAMKAVEPTYTEEEKARNMQSTDLLFVNSLHPLGAEIKAKYFARDEASGLSVPTGVKLRSLLSIRPAAHVGLEQCFSLHALANANIWGYSRVEERCVPCGAPQNPPSLRLDGIRANSTIALQFYPVPVVADHVCRLIPGAKPPSPALNDADRDMVLHSPPPRMAGFTVVDLVEPAQQSGRGRSLLPNHHSHSGLSRSWGSQEPSYGRPAMRQPLLPKPQTRGLGALLSSSLARPRQDPIPPPPQRQQRHQPPEVITVRSLMAEIAQTRALWKNNRR